MHVGIVDNGRSDMIANDEHWQTLKCIRCGACMNTCPVYRRSTGYSYSYFIPGPIGINLGMFKSPQQHSGNLSACSLCLSCDNVCPTKVAPGSQVYAWRQSLSGLGLANSTKKLISNGMGMLFYNPSLFSMSLKFAPIVNHLPRFLVYHGLNDWGKGREMPVFASESFEQMWKKGKVK